MEGIYDRTCRLLGQTAVQRLRRSRVLVVGLGGVGGYLVENLARAGVGSLTLCDGDRVAATDLNRQILATETSQGKAKVQVAAQRLTDINRDLQIRQRVFFLSQETVDALEIEACHYVADAIDSVPAKVLLLQRALEAGIPAISAMGVGNRTDPFRLRMATLEETAGCPLARAVRKALRRQGLPLTTPVLYSDEPCVKVGSDAGERITSSISYMPAVAGSLMAHRIIMDLIRRQDL